MFLVFAKLHSFRQEGEITVYFLYVLRITNSNLKDVSFLAVIIIVSYEFLNDSRLFLSPLETIYRQFL